MKIAAILVLLVALTRPALAQGIDGRAIAIAAGVGAAAWLADQADHAAHRELAWRSRHAADVLSNVPLTAALVLPCIETTNRKDAQDCFLREGVRVGATIGLSELVKRLVKRERPDRSDRLSFWSEHTAIACVAGLSAARQWAGAALCASTAYLRVAAERHWLTDVAVGAAVGFGISRIARW